MIPVLIALSAIPCSNQWPTSSSRLPRTTSSSGPLSARTRVSSPELQRGEDRDRVRFTAIEGANTRSGRSGRFRAANPPVAAGCYQSDENGFPCVSVETQTTRSRSTPS